jgi:hypothetical protein
MKSIRILFLLSIVCLIAVTLAPAIGEAATPFQPIIPSGWSEPKVIYAETWPDSLRFSLDDSATRLVALIPQSGNSETSRHIVVSELVGGAWQEPVVVAENGAYSDAPMQWLPQQTHPLISGDGNSIAYVGYTGATYGVYVVDRLPGGGWGALALVPTGLANTHYRISLSQDGATLALCDYPFLGIQQMYVLTRQAGVWSALQAIGPGGNPSLSADGKKLAYVSNARVAFTEQINGAWADPVQLTDNNPDRFVVEHPQISGDGRAIHYWLVTLIPEGNTLIRTAQDLYVLRRQGSGWGTPQKVTATPILPSSITDGPAAADRYATRLIYTRPVTVTDPDDGHVYIDSSHLEIGEGITSTWQTTRLVEANGYGNYNKWPRLTPDGKTLVFDGSIRYSKTGAVYGALWQMTTGVAPPLPPWAFSITGIFDASGGSLFSAFDNIQYLFGAGVFSDTVEFTHSFWPNPPPPPIGMTDIGGIGGIGGLGGAFAATLLGPGGLPVQPNHPVTITVDYSSTDTGATIPGSLNLWWQNGGNWTQAPSFDNPASGVMTATVSHFSEFAVFGETNQVFLPAVAR